MDITGIIQEIMPEEHISDRFYKQDFILDISRYDQVTGERWVNHVQFQVANGKVPIEQYSVGQRVKVSFYVNGRFYERKDGSGQGFFQNLICTKIEDLSAGNTVSQTAPPIQPVTAAHQTTGSEKDDDDLPF
ncbi:MAG: DUF3127 domain-containing protein [Moheibacter sp.]